MISQETIALSVGGGGAASRDEPEAWAEAGPPPPQRGPGNGRESSWEALRRRGVRVAKGCQEEVVLRNVGAKGCPGERARRESAAEPAVERGGRLRGCGGPQGRARQSDAADGSDGRGRWHSSISATRMSTDF